MAIDSGIAKSLSEKSDQELIAILENPADWMPPVVEFARSELARRSVTVEQIDQKLAINAKQKAEELQQRSAQPLTAWEITSTILSGVLGLLGLVFVIPRASRFKSDGYLLKYKKSWQIYWLTFGIKVALVLLLIGIAVATSAVHSPQ